MAPKNLLKKIGIGTGGTALLGITGLVVFVQLNWNQTHDIPYPDLEATDDPQMIARGKYLVHGPAHCSNCHVGSFEEFERADAGEDVPMAGGVVFPLPIVEMAPANLTPDPETGIARHDDGAVFRMLRHAVKADGTASLAPMMPFSMMADDDLVAIVSYLKTLEPVRREIPEPKWTFMGKALKTFLPPFQPVVGQTPPKTAPPEEPTAERGEYIARYVANCHACHTNHDPATLTFIGPEFAGGAEFEPMPGMGLDPDVWARSPNLTPHETGVLQKFGSVEAWKARFRQGRIYRESPMHWGPFSRMSDADLEALWVFFNGLEPIENEVGATIFRKSEEAG